MRPKGEEGRRGGAREGAGSGESAAAEERGYGSEFARGQTPFASIWAATGGSRGAVSRPKCVEADVQTMVCGQYMPLRVALLRDRTPDASSAGTTGKNAGDCHD
jgi:hypothetical protein